MLKTIGARAPNAVDELQVAHSLFQILPALVLRCSFRALVLIRHTNKDLSLKFRQPGNLQRRRRHCGAVDSIKSASPLLVGGVEVSRKKSWQGFETPFSPQLRRMHTWTLTTSTTTTNNNDYGDNEHHQHQSQ